jgi:D-cysteine desulfhydrase
VYPEDSCVEGGVLAIGGCDARELAREFGTPAYVVAEEDLRARARAFTRALGGAGEVVYASKAFPCTAVLRVFAEEGLGCDVASGGELHLALRAGFAPDRLYLHGNAKSDAELAMALEAGVGTVVLDNEDEAARLAALGGGPRLLVKRDDAIAFAFGGNKVRKLRLIAAQAQSERADTLITCGGVQSNHARVTAAAAAALGMRCILVANGTPPVRRTANALLAALLGAEIHYVPSRADRAPKMDALAEACRSRGGRPYVIPLGASTPLGAAAFAQAVGEMLSQIDPPDAIVHATSSGGTQAGLIAGCRLFELRTRVVGISADEPAAVLAADVRRILAGLEQLLGETGGTFSSADIEIDDSFVGEGYGIATLASDEALRMCATTEALFLDSTYTAKAMAGLIARVRDGRFTSGQTVLFWHTGGQVGLFA